MENPWVVLDLRNHPMYSTVEHYKFLCKRFDAELTMINTNKGSIRCRLYDIDSGKLVSKNFDCSVEWVEEGEISVKL